MSSLARYFAGKPDAGGGPRRQHEYPRREGWYTASVSRNRPAGGFGIVRRRAVLGVQVKYDNPVTGTITAANTMTACVYVRRARSLVEANSRATAIRHPSGCKSILTRYGPVGGGKGDTGKTYVSGTR